MWVQEQILRSFHKFAHLCWVHPKLIPKGQVSWWCRKFCCSYSFVYLIFIGPLARKYPSHVYIATKQYNDVNPKRISSKHTKMSLGMSKSVIHVWRIFLDHRFMRVDCSVLSQITISLYTYQHSVKSVASRKMTSDVAAAFLSHMHFYCTSHQRPIIWRPDHIERSSLSHRQRHNQNNISNRKELLSARFCFMMVPFFATGAHNTLTVNMPPSTSVRRLRRKNISQTKLTNKQNTEYKTS